MPSTVARVGRSMGLLFANSFSTCPPRTLYGGIPRRVAISDRSFCCYVVGEEGRGRRVGRGAYASRDTMSACRKTVSGKSSCVGKNARKCGDDFLIVIWSASSASDPTLHASTHEKNKRPACPRRDPGRIPHTRTTKTLQLWILPTVQCQRPAVRVD